MLWQVSMRAGVEIDNARVQLIWDMCRSTKLCLGWSTLYQMHASLSTQKVGHKILLYYIRYERAWDPTTNSPWCPLFAQEDLDLFNFRFVPKTHFRYLHSCECQNYPKLFVIRQDLVFYYLRAYAYPITAQQTQVLAQIIGYNVYIYLMKLFVNRK